LKENAHEGDSDVTLQFELALRNWNRFYTFKAHTRI